jgi:DNA helicase II / ATP-dependent DNA helicase PcrA
MWAEAGENPAQAQIEDIDTVSLMTVHKAKGLEFAAVFVAGLEAGRFPSRNRSDPIEVPVELIKEELPSGNEHLQEERRLFYVALTRAKQFLYLTYADDIGGLRKRKMSGFCAETGLPVYDISPHTDPLIKLTRPTVVRPQPLKEGKFKIDKLSYSQIDTFDLCPQKYKYRYLLRIPAPPHHSLSFGRTVHQTLYEFHLAKLNGHPVSKAELEAGFTRNFIDEGYDNQEHKELRFQAGLQAMRDYYAAHSDQLGQPIMLEQAFTLRLDSALITGKIDRIDRQGDTYEIIDYKTGSLKKQKDIDKDEQLTMYVLAANSVLNLPITQASLYFIEHQGQKMTTLRTPEDIDKAKVKLEKKIDTIQASDFPAKPNAVKCGFCEFASICPAASKKSAP